MLGVILGSNSRDPDPSTEAVPNYLFQRAEGLIRVSERIRWGRENLDGLRPTGGTLS